MSEMTTAFGAVHLGARHPVAPVDGRRHRLLVDRLRETRPAGSALELAVGREQRFAAARAAKHALTLLLVQRTRSARLGAVFPKHAELLGRQRLAPLVVAFL